MITPLKLVPVSTVQVLAYNGVVFTTRVSILFNRFIDICMDKTGGWGEWKDKKMSFHYDDKVFTYETARDYGNLQLIEALPECTGKKISFFKK